MIHLLKKDKCNFLVGAGVSMLAPCNLPSGPNLKNLLINFTIPQNEKKYFNSITKTSDKFRNIVPEIIFQRLYEVIADKLFPFFEILKHAESNRGHSTLAHLIRKFNSTVFTTNFDDLIDKHTPAQGSIIHLHGHLNKFSEMMVRINQVGKGLSSTQQRIFKKKSAGRPLIVLGYSGNDKDIIDILNASDITEIYWIARDINEARLIKNISQVKFGDKLILVEADLNVFFKDLATQYKSSNAVSKNSRKIFNKARYLRKWSTGITISERYSFIEKILFDIGNYKASLRLCKKAIRLGYFDALRTPGWFQNEAAYTCRHIGDFKSAFGFINGAIKSQHIIPNNYVVANSYNIKGILLLESIPPRPKTAIPFFERAEKRLKLFVQKEPVKKEHQEEMIAFFSRIKNNIGLSYDTMEDHTSAIKYYRESLRLKRKVGNLEGICITSVNICLAYLRNGNIPSYYRWRNRILFLFEKYGFEFSEAYYHREVGSFFCQKNKIKRGLSHLGHARAIYIDIGGSHGLKITDSLMSRYNKKVK